MKFHSRSSEDFISLDRENEFMKKNIGYIYKYYFQKDRLEFYFILLPCTIHHEDKILKKMAPAAGQDFSQLFCHPSINIPQAGLFIERLQY